jgi:hypothetical protein
MLNQSRITKQNSKRITDAEITEIAKKIEVTSNMLVALEIAVSDSRGELFSAFVGDQGCQLLLRKCVRATALEETRNSA